LVYIERFRGNATNCKRTGRRAKGRPIFLEIVVNLLRPQDSFYRYN